MWINTDYINQLPRTLSSPEPEIVDSIVVGLKKGTLFVNITPHKFLNVSFHANSIDTTIHVDAKVLINQKTMDSIINTRFACNFRGLPPYHIGDDCVLDKIHLYKHRIVAFSYGDINFAYTSKRMIIDEQ
jgi:hypothetical protein